MSNQTPDVERSERAVLPGNASFVHTNAAILSVTAVDAPIVVTSDSFDEQLRETYDRIGFRRRDALGRSPASSSADGGPRT